MSFTHLHLNSCYSIKESIAKIDSIVDRVKELGQTSVAITDASSLGGAINFFEACVKKGIKPIIGAEIVIVINVIKDNTTGLYKDEIKTPIVLLCKNEIGYKNLVQLINLTNNNGLYYTRLDYETLKKYSDGLICLSCGIEGRIYNLLLAEAYDEAKYIATNLKEVFGSDNFFLEIQNHRFEYESVIQNGLIRLSKELNIGLVATNCCKYVLKDDSVAYDKFLHLCRGGRVAFYGNSIKDEDEKYYITSEEEMIELFEFCPEALENTKIIADRCNVRLEFAEPYYSKLISVIDNNTNGNVENEHLKEMIKKCNYNIPKYDTPNGFTNKEYLTKLAVEGLEKKYDLKITDNNAEIKKRLNEELSIINDNGFTDLFLIIADYVKYAKDNDIIAGPGRGSAVSSLVCYVLSITDVDPIKNGLLFERFINTERGGLPDIDIDFSIDGLEKIRKYLKDKYGNENVLNISAYATVSNKQVEKCLYVNEAERVDILAKLNGVLIAKSIHASGIMIVPNEKKDFVPKRVDIYNANTRCSIVSQYDMQTLEKLGFVKFDLLGLRCLDIIKSCIDNVKVKNNTDIDFNKISYNDENVYNMISSGETKDVFILDGDGMIEFIKNLRPNKFSDLVLAISVYRPGPDKYIDELVKRKNESQFIERTHPVYDEILVETYGKIIYQEQIIEILNMFSGMNLNRADIVRRSLSKRNINEITEAKKEFIYGNEIMSGCIKNDVNEDTANLIFDNLLESSAYAFNKSHAVAYAKLAYQMAYLKCYYNEDFTKSSINICERKI